MLVTLDFPRLQQILCKTGNGLCDTEKVLLRLLKESIVAMEGLFSSTGKTEQKQKQCFYRVKALLLSKISKLLCCESFAFADKSKAIV